MKLIDVYRDMLRLGPFTSTKKGQVMVSLDGSSGEPFLINKKQVWLPTEHVLGSKNKNKEIFHPLRENIMTGPPATLIAYRNVILKVFNSVHFPMFIQLLRKSQKENEVSPSITLGTVLSRYPLLTDADAKNIIAMSKEANVLNMDLQHHDNSGIVTSTISSPLFNQVFDVLSESGNDRVIGNTKVSLKSLKAAKELLLKFFEFKDSKESAYHMFQAQGTTAKSSEVITTAFGSFMIGYIDDIRILKKHCSDLNEDYKVPSYDFFKYEVFSKKKRLTKLVKSVMVNGSVASKLKMKKKKKKKKKKAKRLENMAQNNYGILNNQQHQPQSTGDSDLDALYRMGMVQQSHNPYVNNQPYLNQPTSPYGGAVTGTAYDQYGIPIPQQPNYGGQAPVIGKFGWSS